MFSRGNARRDREGEGGAGMERPRFVTSPSDGLMTTGSLPEGKDGLPLVVRPVRGGLSAAALATWVTGNHAWVERAILAHGAVLFRGFEVSTPDDFERVALSISPKLGSNYLGTSPRNSLTKHVFTASELPPYYPIPQHCEMSFLKNAPRRLFFHCMTPVTGPGGETPLCDFRAVLRDLDPIVRARFQEKGVTTIRNYAGPNEKAGKFDLWKLKGWPEMFGTTDKAVVQEQSEREGLTVEWFEGDRLRLTNSQPAVRHHPETGEPVWFNHTQVFHLSAAAGEFRRIARRQRMAATLGLAAFAATMVAAKRARLKPEEQAMHCTFGDGSEIPDSDMEAVRDAIWKNLVAFRWQRGDVVAIDNYAVSHGRLPYRGERMVTVAWE